MKRVVFYTYYFHGGTASANAAYNTRGILNSIFSAHAFENNGIRTLEIKMDRDIIFLDVLVDNDAYLFGRLGKEKDIRTIAKRDLATREPSSVLDSDELETKSIESNTYFLLDYQDGIITFVKGQDAPAASSILYVFTNYDQSRTMVLNNIVNPERVNDLMKPGSTISTIHYSFELPSVDILRHIGFTDRQIRALKESDLREGMLVLKNKPRKPITANPDIIASFIGSVKGTDVAKGMILRGKEPTTNTQNYNFNESEIYYEINYPDSKTIEGRKVKLTMGEMADKIYEELVVLYQENKNDLLIYAGKI